MFPGLATADALRDRGHDVTVCFAGKSIEESARRSWTGPAVTIAAENYGIAPAGLVKTVYRLSLAYRQAIRELRLRQPAAVLAMGSYSSIGPVLAARRLKIPVVLHEANVIPGRAVEFLSRFSNAIAVTFPETRQHLRHLRVVVTGIPLRKSLEQAAREPRLVPASFTVLVMGGSQGARRLNDVVPQAAIQLHTAGLALRVIHLAGAADASRVESLYATAGIPHEVTGFQQDMPRVYRETSVAIARSGASSCAELMLFNIPSILIPYPLAARNHQAANAQAMANAGGAVVIEQNDVSVDGLACTLRLMAGDPNRLATMRANIARAAVSGAAARLADLIEQCGAKS